MNVRDINWPSLLSAALVGTDRRPIAAGPEGLLAEVAALSVARRAGRRPGRGGLPPGAPEEKLPPVPGIAAMRLQILLGGAQVVRLEAHQVADLLAEWLRLCADRGLRVPGGLLPDLFDTAHNRPELRAAVRRVGGERARWLATRRPDWAWAGLSEEDSSDQAQLDQEQWRDGTQAERVAYLTALRSRDPALGRATLIEAWPNERPDDRAALLAALHTGLGPDDDGFIEAALGDRRKEVRLAARDLLAVLPGSAFQQRMATRAQACVRVGRTVRVTPPADCDESMRRDGLDVPPPRGVGARAWWLEGIVSFAPLAAWPEGILSRPVDDDWAPVLRRGWARAAIRQRDPVWAAALIRSGWPPQPADVTTGHLAAQLLQVLSPADTVEFALASLTDDRLPTPTLLHLCPRPWPSSLVRAVLDRLRRMSPGARLYDLTRPAALGLPPACAPEVAALAESAQANSAARQRALDELADVLTFRHEMHREFT